MLTGSREPLNRPPQAILYGTGRSHPTSCEIIGSVVVATCDARPRACNNVSTMFILGAGISCEARAIPKTKPGTSDDQGPSGFTAPTFVTSAAPSAFHHNQEGGHFFTPFAQRKGHWGDNDCGPSTASGVRMAFSRQALVPRKFFLVRRRHRPLPSCSSPSASPPECIQLNS